MAMALPSTKTRTANKAKASEAMGAALLVAIQETIKDLGVQGKPSVPRVVPPLEAVNSQHTAALIEYAISKAIQDAAKERHGKARETVRRLFRGELPQAVCRKQIVYQDAFATLAAQVNGGATKIDRTLLERELMSEFELSEQDAKKFIKKVSHTSEPAMMLEVILRS